MFPKVQSTAQFIRAYCGTARARELRGPGGKRLSLERRGYRQENATVPSHWLGVRICSKIGLASGSF